MLFVSGCFIYGNHLPDDEQHTDNLLFPKLISLNSQHFDFENCNFTIKNMYMKDKREGLSKEGSGRVALNKHLGILHSYTLECSYAVGKCCNPIAAAENEAHGGRISPPIPFSLPPKFTIENYRDVGKACALAAIDVLPGRNPFTRVSQSTFKNLQTLRDFLRHQVRQQRNRMGNTRMMPNAVPATVPATNRAKQQQYMARVSQTYRTTANINNLSTVTQQQ
jgi:cytosolic carboxypeptidase protein 5